MQYRYLNTGQSKIYKDDLGSFRIQVRDLKLYFDKALTPLAFAGVENTDWEALVPFYSPLSGIGEYRFGVRDTYFVIDQALTETGFDGDEDIDWEYLNRYKKEV